MAGILGDIGSAVGGLFGKNPYSSGMDYLKQIPGTIKPYYQPYINSGRTALHELMPQYNQMINNPNQLYSKFGQGFQQSPGYQFQVDQATKAANSAAAAGGMLGTPAEQQELAGTVSGLANQDFYHYLSQIMGLYGGGLEGLGHINDMGYNASNELAQSLGNLLTGQAGYGMGQSAYRTGQMQDLGGLIGNLLSGPRSSFGQNPYEMGGY